MALPPISITATEPDLDEWIDLSVQMSEELKGLMWNSPTGEALKSFLDSQAYLITSLPLEAARYAQELAMQTIAEGGRTDALREALQRIGDLTKSRAALIARTEVARAASGLTMVRSMSVGSMGYIWRTSRDSLVRREHKVHEGKYFKWTKPPKAMANGTRAHPGMTPNCRCWAEPIIPKLK